MTLYAREGCRIQWVQRSYRGCSPSHPQRAGPTIFKSAFISVFMQSLQLRTAGNTCGLSVWEIDSGCALGNMRPLNQQLNNAAPPIFGR